MPASCNLVENVRRRSCSVQGANSVPASVILVSSAFLHLLHPENPVPRLPNTHPSAFSGRSGSIVAIIGSIGTSCLIPPSLPPAPIPSPSPPPPSHPTP